MNSLMVHAEIGDTLFNVPAPCWYQSMVVGHHGLVDQQVAETRAKGVKVYRYINLWTAPDPTWVGRGNPLHDYMNSLVEAGFYFRDRNGNPAKTPVFPTYGARVIINYGMMSLLQLTSFVQTVISLDPGPVFTDQAWMRPDWWWFGEDGPVFAEMNLLIILRYEVVMRQILNLMREQREVVVNGTREVSDPLYLEHSQAHWQEHTALWSSRNIFSVEASHHAACQEAVNLWLSKKVRWLAFTSSNLAFRDAAYQMAVNARNQLQGGSVANQHSGAQSDPAVSG